VGRQPGLQKLGLQKLGARPPPCGHESTRMGPERRAPLNALLSACTATSPRGSRPPYALNIPQSPLVPRAVRIYNPTVIERHSLERRRPRCPPHTLSTSSPAPLPQASSRTSSPSSPSPASARCTRPSTMATPSSRVRPSPRRQRPPPPTRRVIPLAGLRTLR